MKIFIINRSVVPLYRYTVGRTFTYDLFLVIIGIFTSVTSWSDRKCIVGF